MCFHGFWVRSCAGKMSLPPGFSNRDDRLELKLWLYARTVRSPVGYTGRHVCRIVAIKPRCGKDREITPVDASTLVHVCTATPAGAGTMYSNQVVSVAVSASCWIATNGSRYKPSLELYRESSASTTALKTCRNVSGKLRPLFSARRRIPRAARGLK